MRRALAAIALGFVAMVGTSCGGDDDTAAPAETTTEQATTTTEDQGPTLSQDARRAVLLCADAQAELAFAFSDGMYDRAEIQAKDALCEEAKAYIEVEAPEGGDTVPQAIAVALSEHDGDLALWAIPVTANPGDRFDEPAITGVRPSEALTRWPAEIRDLLDELPASTS